MERLSAAQRNFLTDAANRYHENVELAAGYLEGRDLWTEATVDGFLLGVVDDPVPGHEDYEGRLSIPYLTPSGVVSIKFRCIEDHDCKDAKCAKYLGLSHWGDRLYNVQALHDATDVIYITEGELDAMSATLAGAPAVGISGATKWQPHYIKVFEDFERVIVLADGDATKDGKNPGREFAKRMTGELHNARSIVFPVPHDANSYLREFGRDAFWRLVR